MLGMEKYYVDPLWRLQWDEYQVDEQCCGVEGFKDWLTREWMDVKDEAIAEGRYAGLTFSRFVFD